jgi:glycosyltransferase involved in cell wall biosynthesis
MKLSILVCSVHTRRNTFLPKILDQLYNQFESLSPEDQNEVEILVLIDNKKIMLGTKRNYMVDIACGEYVVFVDDDDRVSGDYIKILLDAANKDKDCITFMAEVSINGETPKHCIYSAAFSEDRNFDNFYHRIPNHICAIKRSICKQVHYPAIPYGEDSGFSKSVKELLNSETFIDRVLYFYDYNSDTTETQQHLAKRKKRLK